MGAKVTNLTARAAPARNQTAQRLNQRWKNVAFGATLIWVATNGTNSPMGFAAPNGIVIDCVLSNGQLLYPDRASKVCKSTLPKCTDFMAGGKYDFAKQVKEMLSWKIYGFYQGKEVNFKESTFDSADPTKTVLKGKDFKQPICSVVGHKLKSTVSPSVGSLDYPEALNQVIGKKASCGLDPYITVTKQGKTFKVDLKSKATNFAAYLNGAYPWFLRREAKAILGGLGTVDSLKGLGALIKDENQFVNEVKSSLANLEQTQTLLSASELAVCNQTTPVVCDGTQQVTDNVLKVCYLQGARDAVNAGVLPNLLAFQIESDAAKNFKQRMASLFEGGDPSKRFDIYFKEVCGAAAPDWKPRNQKLACAASCLLGKPMQYIKTGDRGEKTEKLELRFEEDKDQNSVQYGNCYMRFRSALMRDQNKYLSDAKVSNSDPKFQGFKMVDTPNTSPDINNWMSAESEETLTRLSGFAGIVEKIIRRDVCGQTSITDTAPNCYEGDSTGISSKPAGMP